MPLGRSVPRKALNFFVCVTFIVDRLRCCCFYYIALVGAKKAKATVNNANTGAEFSLLHRTVGRKVQNCVKKKGFYILQKYFDQNTKHKYKYQ